MEYGIVCSSLLSLLCSVLLDIVFIDSVKVALYFVDYTGTEISLHSNFCQTKVHSLH